MVNISKELGISRRKAIASEILSKRKIVKKLKPKRFGLEKGRVVLKSMKIKRYGKTMKTIAEDKKKKAGVKSNIKDAGIPTKRTLLMRVEISEAAKDAATWLFGEHKIPNKEFMDDLKGAMNAMYFDIYRYINDKKSQLIPTNTGALKRSLLRSLTANKSDISTGILIVEIGTHLPYLKFVHEMETTGVKPHLRHPPYPTKTGLSMSPKGATYLPEIDDPKAVKHFLDWIIIEARKRANKIFSDRVIQMIYNKYKSLFGWTRWTQAAMLFNWVKW